MKIHPKVKSALIEINFPVRYKRLSERFQYHDESFQTYSNERVVQIANELGVELKHSKSDNFFKVANQESEYNFSLNISLKYGSVELILGVKSLKNEITDGGPFGVLYRHALENEERIKLPAFRNYNDLQEILKEGFETYKNFKKEIQDSIEVKSNSLDELSFPLKEKLKTLIFLLSKRKNSAASFFENVLTELSHKKTETEAVNKLRGCYSITQYANFSYEEEKILDKVLKLCTK